MLVLAALLAFAVQDPSPHARTQTPTALPPIEATADPSEPDPNREIWPPGDHGRQQPHPPRLRPGLAVGAGA